MSSEHTLADTRQASSAFGLSVSEGHMPYLGYKTYYRVVGNIEASLAAVSYTHLTLPTMVEMCRSRWSPYH